MANKQIEIRIFKDGTIRSKTKNIKGKSCMKYLQIIEAMSGAKAVDSEFTEEYYESEQTVQAEEETVSYVEETLG